MNEESSWPCCLFLCLVLSCLVCLFVCLFSSLSFLSCFLFFAEQTVGRLPCLFGHPPAQASAGVVCRADWLFFSADRVIHICTYVCMYCKGSLADGAASGFNAVYYLCVCIYWRFRLLFSSNSGRHIEWRATRVSVNYGAASSYHRRRLWSWYDDDDDDDDVQAQNIEVATKAWDCVLQEWL